MAKNILVSVLCSIVAAIITTIGLCSFMDHKKGEHKPQEMSEKKAHVKKEPVSAVKTEPIVVLTEPENAEPLGAEVESDDLVIVLDVEPEGVLPEDDPAFNLEVEATTNLTEVEVEIETAPVTEAAAVNEFLIDEFDENETPTSPPAIEIFNTDSKEELNDEEPKNINQ